MNVLAYVHLRNIYNSTGAGRVARQIIEHLRQEPDVNLHFLADRNDLKKIFQRQESPWIDFNYHCFNPSTSKQQARWIFTHRPVAESFWSDTQIVYCTGESYVPTKRSRLVVTLHDAAFFEPDAHRQTWATFQQKFKWKILYGVLSRKADLFHTVSHFSAERIAHFFPKLKSRIRVIHNAVPPRFFQPTLPEGDQFLQHLNLLDRPFILLPRGLWYRKNADLVLQAWSFLHTRHPDLQLVISSHCDPAYQERVQALGKTLKDTVILTGFVSDDELCSLYHAARLVWFPSLYEGFGLPVLEAMACGTPVVASNASALPEVAGDAALLVSPHKVDEHVEVIEMLLQQESMRQQLSLRGKLHAQQFTWERSAAQLRQHFQSLL
jgi:glycosyltransferase involved in cell wall biosynthesis